MKKILILTDLSDQSIPAAETAVMLSAKLNANLILLNTFISEPSLSEYTGTPWPVDQLLWADKGKEKLAFIKEGLEPQIAGLPAGDHHASMDCRQEIGRLGPQVAGLLKKEAVEMIVMGARNGSAWDHLLSGSDTLSVIEHTDRPVMVVPAGRPLTRLAKVTIATDLDEADLEAVHYLTRLGRTFGFRIEIVHVRLWGAGKQAEGRLDAFKKQVARFNFHNITFQEVSGKDLTGRLNKLCAVQESDLLVLVHDRHQLLERLFKGTHTRSLLEKQKFPVMIIPAGLQVK